MSPPKQAQVKRKADCFDWLSECPPNSLHAVCTDPPYGLLESSEKEIAKLRAGRGGVWRLPPAIGGSQRSCPVLVRALLPLGEGVVCDPFMGSGSTIAAAEAVGYKSIGLEIDEQYYSLAKQAIPRLAALYPRFRGEETSVELDYAVPEIAPSQLDLALAEDAPFMRMGATPRAFASAFSATVELLLLAQRFLPGTV
jgi:hypothetical protein